MKPADVKILKTRVLPREMELSWQNHLIPVIVASVLVASSFTLGYYNASFLWIFLFILLYVIKTHVWIKAERRRENLRTMILRERDFVMSQYTQINDLPAWVQFPDIERIEWMNKIINQLWPYIGEYAKEFLHEYIEPEIRSQMPTPFKNFKFVAIDMGDVPCRVGGIKVYTQNVGRDRVVIDMDVVYAGDAEFMVKTCGFLGGINQLVLSGRVRCVLQPLLPYPPMVGGISGSFIELPKFDFNLTGVGEFVQIPGLIDAIRTIINKYTASFAVLPNKIVIPLVPNVDISRLYFPEPDGIIRIKIIEAKNLENKDFSFLPRDKSDPYCEIKVGSQVFRTKTIKNDLNPVFDECFEAVVDQASGQKLRIEVFDEDTAGADDELGRLSLPLEVVREAGQIEKSYHLEGCKHGDLKLQICWMNLTTHMDRDILYNEWQQTGNPIHPALLMVFIDNVSNLPFPKENLEPSPYVEVSLGRNSQRTFVKAKTINPLYQSKFIFFVKHPEGQELRIKSFDDGTKRQLGELFIPLITIMDRDDMEIYQETFNLVHGIHSSPIVLTVRLRFFAPNEGVPGHAAGTHSHIERSERIPNVEINNNNENSISPTPLLKDNENKAGIVREKSSETTLVKANGSIASASVQDNLKDKPIASASRSPSLTSSTRSKLRKPSFLNKLFVPHSRMRKSRSIESAVTSGQLHIGIRYSSTEFKLLVDVYAARDLIPVEENNRCDPYVSVRLCDSTRVLKRKTAIIVNSLNPQFDEHFLFDIHSSAFKNHTLEFFVKDSINYGVARGPPILGSVCVHLKDYDPSSVVNKWVDLKADA